MRGVAHYPDALPFRPRSVRECPSLASKTPFLESLRASCAASCLAKRNRPPRFVGHSTPIAGGQTLVDDVANTYSLQIRFSVSKTKPIWERVPSIKREQLTLHVFDDALDPSAIPPNAKFEMLSLTLGELLNHVISYTSTNDLTVKDAIKYAANAAGGRHFDPSPKPEYAAQAAANANARQSCFRFHRSEVDAYANDADQAIRTSPLRPSKAATIRIGPVA